MTIKFAGKGEFWTSNLIQISPLKKPRFRSSKGAKLTVLNSLIDCFGFIAASKEYSNCGFVMSEHEEQITKTANMKVRIVWYLEYFNIASV